MWFCRITNLPLRKKKRSPLLRAGVCSYVNVSSLFLCVVIGRELKQENMLVYAYLDVYMYFFACGYLSLGAFTRTFQRVP